MASRRFDLPIPEHHPGLARLCYRPPPEASSVTHFLGERISGNGQHHEHSRTILAPSAFALVASFFATMVLTK
jgi:hypothetical protein